MCVEKLAVFIVKIMKMSWGDHIFLGYSQFISVISKNTNNTFFYVQNCLHLDSRLYGHSQTIFQRKPFFFKEIFVVILAILKIPNFFKLFYSQRLVEYKYFWNKTLSLLTFTKRELTSIKNEVYDNFQNWTSLKGEVFLQIKSISETAFTGLLYIFRM